MNTQTLKEFIPIGTFLLIICSSIKLITFYDAFGIDIINYIKLSEVTFSFLDDIYKYLTLLGFYIIWWTIDDLFIARKEESKVEDSISQRNYVRDIVIQIMIVNLICLLLSIFIRKDSITFQIGQILLVFILALSQRKVYQFSNLIKYYVLFFVVLAYTYFQAKIDISNLKDDNKFAKVSIIFDGEEIKSSKENYFIGRTENYTFFYNPKDAKTTIYANSKISKIEKDR